MYYIVYKTTNKTNGKYYIGAHKTANKNDTYLGSGKALTQAIKKYGKDNFYREILFECDTIEEMYDTEKRLVAESLNDRKSYNLRSGGKGGWDHVDNSGINNPMKDPKIRKKCIERGKNTRSENPEKYASIARENLKKAMEKVRGVKKPWLSELSKKRSKELWLSEEYREKFKNSKNSWFELTNPTGDKIVTNRLTEFCNKNDLPFSSIWSNTKSNKKISKGKAKGWKCKIIQK